MKQMPCNKARYCSVLSWRQTHLSYLLIVGVGVVAHGVTSRNEPTHGI